MQKINDRRSLAKKFGVGDDVEEMPSDAVTNHALRDPFIGVDRYCALLHEYLVRINALCDLTDDSFNIRQIGRAGVTLRSTDRNEDGLALLDSRVQIRGEVNTHVLGVYAEAPGDGAHKSVRRRPEAASPSIGHCRRKLRYDRSLQSIQKQPGRHSPTRPRKCLLAWDMIRSSAVLRRLVTTLRP